jgi:hypothetical protein
MQIRWKGVLDLGSISGAIILFGSWAFQQTLLNQANSALSAIHVAEAGFETYQSNNTLFNALNAAVPAATSEIRRFQVVNYELALRHLEIPLSSEETARLPSVARPFDGNWDADTAMQQTQSRIDAIWKTLGERKTAISAHTSLENRIFIFMYAAGSLLILLTNACKTFLPKD